MEPLGLRVTPEPLSREHEGGEDVSQLHIERYEYIGPQGGKGVQWLVYEGDRLVYPYDSRKQAQAHIAAPGDFVLANG